MGLTRGSFFSLLTTELWSSSLLPSGKTSLTYFLHLVFKCNLNDFDCGMIVSARRVHLNTSETADLLGFSHTKVSTELNGAKNKKTSTDGSSVGGNAFLMREVIPETKQNWTVEE